MRHMATRHLSLPFKIGLVRTERAVTASIVSSIIRTQTPFPTHRLHTKENKAADMTKEAYFRLFVAKALYLLFLINNIPMTGMIATIIAVIIKKSI